MSGTAALNVWHAMRQELGVAVVRELSFENDPTATRTMRRMRVELRVFCALPRAS